MRRASAALLLIGCFSTDPGDRRFPCDESHGCPPGRICQNNICQLDTAAPLDASTVDQASGDMSVSPCSGNGYPLGSNGVWACLGTFSPAKPASSLCVNRKICNDIRNLVTASECTSAPNVLVGVPGNGSGINASCATASSGPNLIYFGCGNRSKPTKSEPANGPCRGHTMVHFYNADGIIYNNSSYSVDNQTNNDPNAGVLCCP